MLGSALNDHPDLNGDPEIGCSCLIESCLRIVTHFFHGRGRSVLQTGEAPDRRLFDTT